MSAIDEIVAAAAKLNAAQLVKLRQKLDRLEQKTWETEVTAVTARMKHAKITEDEIDRKVMSAVVKVVLDTMLWVSYCTLQDGRRQRIIERTRRNRANFFWAHWH